jgi:hypothetical protein
VGQNLSFNDLIEYHLYRIHKKEIREEDTKIDLRDLEYGQKAFEMQEASSMEDRKRAVSCAQIEIWLFLLKKAIEKRREPFIKEALDALEKLYYSKNDLPPECESIAHHLYKEVFFASLEGWNNNNKQVDNSFYETNVGKIIFGSMESILFMQIAVEKTLIAISKAWRE